MIIRTFGRKAKKGGTVAKPISLLELQIVKEESMQPIHVVNTRSQTATEEQEMMVDELCEKERQEEIGNDKSVNQVNESIKINVEEELCSVVEVVRDEELMDVEVREKGDGKSEDCQEVELKTEGNKQLEPPTLTKGGQRTNFIKQLRLDLSFHHCRVLAYREERGYCWQEGILLKVSYEIRGEIELLVLPKSERVKVLQAAHEYASHGGTRKVLKLIIRNFVWPFMKRCI